MKTAIYSFQPGGLHRHHLSQEISEAAAGLVLCFGTKALLQDKNVFLLLKNKFPSATIALCSTAGEIYHTEVLDHTITVTAIEFAKTTVQSQEVNIGDFTGSYEAGKALIQKFTPDGLSYILILSDGSRVNAGELVRGLNEAAPPEIFITGGLAGDGDHFKSTLVGINAEPREGLIIGIGFYGKHLQVSHGSQGGWETFGLEKLVTRSRDNVLYEIGNRNALELYKKYLGPEAASLPGSALLFPLALIAPGSDEPVVRTILSVDDEQGTMTFAGDIPVGSRVRLMKANFDKLTHAAAGAAIQAQLPANTSPGLALLISCVGRKLILRSRTEEEVEAVDEVFDHKTILTGFYSYGEISPPAPGGDCQLHNQTMTITTFYETE